MGRKKTAAAEGITPEPCPDCDGTGHVPGMRYTVTLTCSTCDGTGEKPDGYTPPVVEEAAVEETVEVETAVEETEVTEESATEGEAQPEAEAA